MGVVVLVVMGEGLGRFDGLCAEAVWSWLPMFALGSCRVRRKEAGGTARTWRLGSAGQRRRGQSGNENAMMIVTSICW